MPLKPHHAASDNEVYFLQFSTYVCVYVFCVMPKVNKALSIYLYLEYFASYKILDCPANCEICDSSPATKCDKCDDGFRSNDEGKCTSK